PPLREQIAQPPSTNRRSSIAPEHATFRNISERESSPPSLFEYPSVPAELKDQPDSEPEERRRSGLPLPPSQTPRPASLPVAQMQISTSNRDKRRESAGSHETTENSDGEQLTAIEDLPTRTLPATPIGESGLIQREAAMRPEPEPVAESDNVSIEDLPTRSMP